jgi:hypothetical protein
MSGVDVAPDLPGWQQIYLAPAPSPVRVADGLASRSFGAAAVGAG